MEPSTGAAGSVTAGVDLQLDFRPERGVGGSGGTGKPGVRVELERALRTAIRAGLPAGTRLPSSRTLAGDLGLSRNTVAEAYGQLVAEGWLTSRQGSGTQVARLPPSAIEAETAGPVEPRPPAYSLLPGSPDVTAFPRAAWSAAARRAMIRAPHDAFGYGDPRGRPELRNALSGYLARARGVHASPDRLVVCAGFTQGLYLLARVLAGRSPGLATEPFGLPVVRAIATASGLPLTVLDADAEGVLLDPLTGPRGSGEVGALLVSPAHQFPLGVALAPRRRRQAVEWAVSSGALVLEDDYDGEFRYDRQPVAALQGLDPDRVVYLGTTSKSLAPGLRLGWMVLPADLIEPVLEVKQVVDRQSSVLDQLTLAELIDSGGYDRQIRRMRLVYRHRRDRLLSAVRERHPALGVHGLAAGLQLLVELPAGASEAQAVAAARRRGLAVEGLAGYAFSPTTLEIAARPPTLVVGYASPPDHAFSGAVARLLAVLDELAGSRSRQPG